MAKGVSRMLEKQIEFKLVRGVKDLGGKAYKFVSPGNIGVPDRIVIWPNGVIHFVELKTVRGRTTKLQDIQRKMLLALNQTVFTLYGPDEVTEYLQSEGKRNGEKK